MLLELKKQLVFEYYFSTKLVQWNKGGNDCCKWNGVECDGGGHVIGLQLDNEGISGGLNDSSSLLRLEYLEKLNLAYNDLETSQFPRGIEKLTHLTHLNLSGAGFSGRFPSEISQLRSLVSLDLSNVFFDKPLSEYTSLRILLHNLTQLTELYLDGIDLSTQGSEWVHAISSSLPFLTSLSLEDCNVSAPSDNSLSHLHYLSHLRLFRNNLSTVDPKIFANFSRLITLSLQSCSLQGYWPEVILDLSNNRLAGEIPSWIWEIGNGTLYHLDLSCNMLVDLQRPYTTPTSLYLEILDLHSNLLRGELPLSLQQATYVDLSNNYFDKSFPYTANYNISAPFPLLYLSLANNSLSGSFPSFLGSCTRLDVLDLSVNNLSGSIPLGQFEIIDGLQVLNLRSNNISGRIPNKFSPDCNLKFLDLSHNNLVGHVPLSLAKCYGLQLLNVGSNHIDDVFPCMLPPSMKVVVLRSNRFHGEIKCHRSWPDLQIIDISSNNLSGSLNPSTFSGWKGMRQNSDAMLKGPFYLGVSIGRMAFSYSEEVTLIIKGLQLKLVNIFPQFTAIDFSCNNFQGDIPDSVCELNGLHLLNLSHNSLTGTIPRSFSNLTQLEAVDLSVNQLRGEIPKELAGLTFLQIMNLSHNHLVGKIPVGSQIQTFPADSFQGNTGLCGLPLNVSCTNNTSLSVPPNPVINGKTEEIEWVYVFAALGYAVGLGIIVWMLLCCSNFRNAYFDKVEDAFDNIFHRRRHRKRRRGATRAVRIQLARQQRQR